MCIRDSYELVFSRFVSMERLHVIGQKLSVRPLDGDAQLDISGGINGQMTNSGSQHFSEGDKRLFEGRHMQYTQTTGQSKIDFIFNTTFSFAMDGEKREEPGFIVIDRRIIKQEMDDFEDFLEVSGKAEIGGKRYTIKCSVGIAWSESCDVDY